MVRNFFEMFLRARRSLEFSHSQDPHPGTDSWPISLVVWRTNGGDAVSRTRAEEYRRRSQGCLIAASVASTEEARAALVEMAKSWLRLAQEQEEERANILSRSTPLPNRVQTSHPVAQQQQQIQPKRDDLDS